MEVNKHAIEVNFAANITERLFDAKEYEANTHINLPGEEAVEDAKRWIDDHEL